MIHDDKSFQHKIKQLSKIIYISIKFVWGGAVFLRKPFKKPINRRKSTPHLIPPKGVTFWNLQGIIFYRFLFLTYISIYLLMWTFWKFRFIEDLFEVVFSISNGVCAFPACVKYMFDCLDEMVGLSWWFIGEIYILNIVSGARTRDSGARCCSCLEK